MNYRIAIGTDHRGYELKEFLKENHTIGCSVIDWIDVGAQSSHRTDYPPFALQVSSLVITNEVDLGILLCGSGIGMAIAANRFAGIYAGVVWNEQLAQMAKEDDNVNVLVLPADFVTQEQALPIVRSWLSATFQAGRYQQRIEMIDKINS